MTLDPIREALSWQSQLIGTASPAVEGIVKFVVAVCCGCLHRGFLGGCFVLCGWYGLLPDKYVWGQDAQGVQSALMLLI